MPHKGFNQQFAAPSNNKALRCILLHVSHCSVTAAREEFLQMELAWVRTVRKGRRPDLASYALEREFQIIVQLEALRGDVASPNRHEPPDNDAE